MEEDSAVRINCGAEFGAPNGSKKGKGINQGSAKSKLRTPSGQVLSSSVKDIRNFFSNEEKNANGGNVLLRDKVQSTATKWRKAMKPFNQRNVNSQEDDADSEGSQPWTEVKSKKDQIGVNKQQIDTRQHAEHAEEADRNYTEGANYRDQRANVQERKHESEDEEQLTQIISKEINVLQQHKQLQNDIKEKKIKELDAVENMLQDNNTMLDQIKSVNQNPDKEAGKNDQQISHNQVSNSNTKPENPEIMDVQLVMEMFNDLKSELQNMKQDTAEKNKKAEEILNLRREEIEEAQELKKEVGELKQKNIVLTSVIGRLGSLFIDLDKKVERMELYGMKRSIVLGGLRTDDKMNKCVKQIQNFFKDVLKLEDTIEIVECFKMGLGPEKPVVLTVNTMEQKIDVFQAVGKYREMQKKRDKICKVFASDYQTPETREKRRQYQRILRENNDNESTKIDMELDRAGLKIQGVQYDQPVQPPPATKILRYKAEEVSEIFSIKTGAGESFRHNGSVFQGYVVPVNTVNMINKAYMKLRLIHPQAQHLMSAFSVPGLPRCYNKGDCDDKEIGAGRMLQDMIRDSHLNNIALFVVRTQHGPKIGSVRFDMIQKAAISAVERNPDNSYMNIQMVLLPRQLQKNTQPSLLNMGAKYRRGSYRGSRKGRGTNTTPSRNDQTKRREYSPETQHEEAEENIFQFAPPKDFSFELSGPPSLGSSWPSLSRAGAM